MGYKHCEKDAHAKQISGQWCMSSHTIACQSIKIRDLQYTKASFQ